MANHPPHQNRPPHGQHPAPIPVQYPFGQYPGQPPPGQYSPGGFQQGPPALQPPKKSSTGMWIGVTCAVIIALFAGITLVMSLGGSDDAADEAEAGMLEFIADDGDLVAGECFSVYSASRNEVSGRKIDCSVEEHSLVVAFWAPSVQACGTHIGLFDAGWALDRSADEQVLCAAQNMSEGKCYRQPPPDSWQLFADRVREVGCESSAYDGMQVVRIDSASEAAPSCLAGQEPLFYESPTPRGYCLRVMDAG